MRIKRICAFIVALTVAFSFKPVNTYAASEVGTMLSIDRLLSNDNEGVLKLGIARRLLYETARVLESPNNMIVVDEISQYDWYWAVNPELTSEYINDFDKAIDQNKSIDEKRNRLQYLFDQNKASVVAKLVPNALHFINVAAANKDPMRATIALSGMALSAVKDYTTEKQRTEIDMIQKQWELDDEQKQTFEELTENLRSYLSKLCKQYEIGNEKLASIKTIRSFVKQCSNDSNSISASDRFLSLDKKQFREELALFPQYWAQLAIAKYEMGDYKEALQYITKYETQYVQCTYHDDEYARLMEIKAYCINETSTSDNKWRILEDTVEEIQKMSSDSGWEQKYFCAQIYNSIAEHYTSKESEYRKKAADILKEVTNQIADTYREDLNDYFEGENITELTDGIQANIKECNEKISALENSLKHVGKTQKKANRRKIKEYEKEVKRLKNNLKELKKMDDQFLPPNSSLLFVLTKELKEVGDKAGITSDSNYKLLLDKISNLLTDTYSQKELFYKDKSDYAAVMSYDRNQVLFVNIDDNLGISVPAKYFMFVTDRFNPKEDRLFLLIDSFKYQLENYSYSVKKEGNKKLLDDISILFTAKVKGNIETGLSLEEDKRPSLSLLIESDSMQDDAEIGITSDDTEEFFKTFKYSEKTNR